MTETEKNFNKWFDEYADGVQVFEETDMKMAYLQGCADEVEKWIKAKEQLEAQIEKMKCCGNCIHCKYDENEESYEFCEKHQQVVNITIVPCSEYVRR